MSQDEILDFAMEQGNMMQVLMLHCQNMKRQETRLRLATAFLFASVLATLVWIQFRQQTTDTFSVSRLEALSTEKESLSFHFKSSKCMTGVDSQQLIEWVQIRDGSDNQIFNLINNSVLNVLTKGLYFINLRMAYRINNNTCQSGHKLILDVSVTQQHSSYLKEINVVTGSESVPCKSRWLQSVTLFKAIELEADTILRVKINSKACKFIGWGKSYLDVTYL